uniref:Putative secreted protein n=1 Tax=Anopheles marajoara TaxID=58244 RepID=A0A2M4CB90_9DIPT
MGYREFHDFVCFPFLSQPLVTPTLHSWFLLIIYCYAKLPTATATQTTSKGTLSSTVRLLAAWPIGSGDLRSLPPPTVQRHVW